MAVTVRESRITGKLVDEIRRLHSTPPGTGILQESDSLELAAQKQLLLADLILFTQNLFIFLATVSEAHAKFAWQRIFRNFAAINVAKLFSPRKAKRPANEKRAFIVIEEFLSRRPSSPALSPLPTLPVVLLRSSAERQLT